MIETASTSGAQDDGDDADADERRAMGDERRHRFALSARVHYKQLSHKFCSSPPTLTAYNVSAPLKREQDLFGFAPAAGKSLRARAPFRELDSLGEKATDFRQTLSL